MRKYKRTLNRFSITITDVNGSRHFYLSDIAKKIALYTILFIVLFVICSSAYIRYLSSKVGELDEKREILTQMNLAIEQNMSIQAQRYAGIEDKISSFEEELGVDSNATDLSPSARMAKLELTNEQQTEVLAQIPNGWPIMNQGITGNYGWRHHPVMKKEEFHNGIDLAAVMNTPVYATANGVIESAGWNAGGYGYMVVVVHNYGFKTAYAHLNKVVISPGKAVKKGDLIAYSGNTGLSTGPHLHYEVRFINKTLPPSDYLNLNRKNMENLFKQERRVPWESLINLISTQASQKQR